MKTIKWLESLRFQPTMLIFRLQQLAGSKLLLAIEQIQSIDNLISVHLPIHVGDTTNTAKERKSVSV